MWAGLTYLSSLLIMPHVHGYKIMYRCMTDTSNINILLLIAMFCIVHKEVERRTSATVAELDSEVTERTCVNVVILFVVYMVDLDYKCQTVCVHFLLCYL